MKKIIIVLAVMLISVTGFSQSVFDKFEDNEQVASIILNQKMFKMLATMGMDLDDPEAKGYVDMANNVTGFKVFTTGDAKVSADMNATVAKYLKSSSLEELMRIKDGDQTVKFFVKEGKDENHVKELLMVITGLSEMTKDQNIEINGKKRDFETVVMTLTGDIDLRQISKLTNQMNIPGGDQLKKAGDKNKN
ncbi:DUF4252 domain-containing protein [Winogradskyella sp.]|uniref:DUF4252 domain-containing protein n=1 Tax=uncultured Winogradskyella sp. TaxID=395353 RepID=UPI00233607F8|nr:DUF4252 domain-containing protein [Winogradskyella sp.]MDB9782648.1 DUF4252 domain-containing protein [Winogradskyella sp.]MDC1505538.1 DUF4252 domain-containing protein [Winogradskyella sp.]|tara:strand:+ start:117272 stop:117847 length:576 start_codon:yes stop_codon:yes gene_type:complete